MKRAQITAKDALKKLGRGAVTKVTALALLAVLLIVSLAWLTQKEVPVKTSLRVGIPWNSPVAELDTASVATIAEAIILDNLFSPLVEFSDDGQIVPGVASGFQVNDGEIRFTIRPDLFTADGIQITAEDALISLKRLLLLGENTHGDLKAFLCKDSEIKKLSDGCPGIRTEGNDLVLKPHRAENAPFLIPLLASSDFLIVPKASIDLQSPTLPIKNFHSTSGPYYLAQDNGEGSFTFKANPRHYLYNASMPQTLEFVSTRHKSAYEMFRDGKVDFITSADELTQSEAERIRADEPEASVHETIRIKLFLFQFSQVAQKQFTVEQRRFLGNVAKDAFLAEFTEMRLHPTQEFFQVLGEGGLGAERAKVLNETFANTSPQSLPRKVRLGVPKRLAERFEKAFRNIPEIQIQPLSQAPWTMDPAEQPDFFYIHTDSGFYENVSLLSYNISIGTFGLTEQESKEWMAKYIATNDKALRLERLSRLHFDFLSNAVVVPIGTAPYFSVAKAPWKIKFSSLYAGTNLWQVQAH